MLARIQNRDDSSHSTLRYPRYHRSWLFLEVSPAGFRGTSFSSEPVGCLGSVRCSSPSTSRLYSTSEEDCKRKYIRHRAVRAYKTLLPLWAR
jgi:hypothetical protein